MLPYPHIDPVALHIATVTLPGIGPMSLDIRWYALAYLVGVLVGWLLVSALNKRSAPAIITAKAAEDIVFYAILGIVLGGRLGYALFYKPGFYLHHPLELLMVWHGGMSFHGGLIGMIAAMAYFAHKYTIPFLRLTDLLAVAAPIGICLGRLANFINGELFGRVTDSPLGMVFPSGGDLPRYPSQLFEAGLEGMVLFALMLILAFATRARHYSGLLSGIFLLGYCAARSTAECFREPDAFIGYLPGGITMGQLLCAPMLLVGLYLILRACRSPALP